MATRDPLVDGSLMAFDQVQAAVEGGTDPAAAMELLAGNDMEPVDQFLAEAGEFDDVQADVSSAALAGMSVVSLGDLLSEMRRDAMDERWALDENTLLNFAFKNGHHYVEVDRARRGVVQLPAPRNHVRRKIHKFGPWYRAQHGQLSSNTPSASIHPTSRNQDDRDAASFADELREWVLPQAYSFQQRSQNAMWMLLGGVCTAYVGVEWSPDPEYEQATGFSHKPDLDIAYLSPMEVWTDNRHSTIDQMRWFGRDVYLPEPEARALYIAEDQQNRLIVESELSDPHEHGYWTLRQLQRFLGREDPWGRFASGRAVDRYVEEQEVITCEYWGRKGIVLQGAFLHGLQHLNEESLTVEVLQDDREGRSPLVRFPNGLRVVMTPEGHILEIADNHTPGGALPFREFKLAQSAGYWTIAWATPLREINMAFDWVFSLREEHLVRTANPVFLEPKEARISRRGSASGTSMRVKYRANRFNVKPEWANPPAMPSDIIEFIRELQELWMEIGGRREVSQGTLPARLSGIAVSLLQEADAAQLGYAGNELEDGHADVLRMALLNIQAFFPENDPRLLKLAGDTPFKLQAFMQADLMDDLDIQVQKGSAVPRSASAIKQTSLELFQAGALIDPNTGLPDWKRVMKVFEFGTDDELYAEDEMDRQNARDEEEAILGMHPLLAAQVVLLALEDGVLPEPFALSAYDNHVVHEKSHRMRLKRIEGDERIPIENKKLLELHWTLTVQGALPVLIQSDPVVAAAFLSPPEGQGGGEEAAVAS